MGFFDFLTGTKRPAPGKAPVTGEALGRALMALNRETAPFHILPDESGKGDYVAEWKIVDARWYEIFAKAGLERVFRIRMKLDSGKHEIRAVDEEYTIEWKAGIPSLSLAASGFRGQKKEVSFGTAYAFTEEFRPGQVYKYRFNTGEIRKPLQEVVVQNGWTWRAVAFGKL